MTVDELRAIVQTIQAVAQVVAPLEPLVVGVGEVVFSALTSHVKATLPEIEAQWVLNEVQSAAFMKPPEV